MNFINKYSTFSRWIYLIILGLTIPFYLLLYGASGHEFNPPIEDVIWMTVVIVAFGAAIIYFLTFKEKVGRGFHVIRILFSITLLLTAYGGIKSLLFITQFDYGDDINFIIRGLSYLIPLVFTSSSIIILLGLFNNKSA